MTKEEIKEVFSEETSRIRKKIDDNRERISLFDIDTEIWSVYSKGGRLYDYMFESVYGLSDMKVAIYTYYMIVCNVCKQIPKTGYSTEENKHETAVKEIG